MGTICHIEHEGNTEEGGGKTGKEGEGKSKTEGEAREVRE